MRQVVGLDLGTSNSTLARVLPDSNQLETVPILQRVSATETATRNLLPSFLYLPGGHELAADAMTLPWDEDRDYLVGEFAREQGARVPGRVVSSAKSWLAHRKLDPTEPILPWERAKDLDPISPVEATSRYLLHLVESWNHQFPEESLQNQEVILTVPASFDELARKLTAGAAAENGLAVRLLEEPQAAFYSWLWRHPKDWKKLVEVDEHILVCDIGGGTTDFTLIKLGEDGFERVAVGDHLMLGGDNLDIALAHHVEPRLGAKLDLLQWGVLRHQSRRAKELLLSDDPPDEANITVPGSGARMLKGALTDTLSREEVERLVLDGFFPTLAKDDIESPEAARKGLKEWGLPYESDPAVPRHLARFLAVQKAPVPAKVLFNGGACRPPALRRRLLDILSEWRGQEVSELENPESDLAVARGAAWFGHLRRSGGMRIGGGSARSYYLGLADQKALCVVPRNLVEGHRIDLAEPELKLLVNQPARFPLFSSSNRVEDEPGDLVDIEALADLGPLETVVKASKARKNEVSVHLSAEVTEVGTLDLWAQSDNNRYSLEFPIREGSAAGAAVELQSRKVRQARALIEDTFNLKPSKLGKAPARPRTMLSVLESEMGPRDEWSLPLNRAFWDSLNAVARRRRVEPEYEAGWFNAVGYCLRPGFGVALDEWRIDQMAEVLDGWMQFPKDDKVKIQFWIMWRRLAPGLPTQVQLELWNQLHPVLLPGRKHIKTRNKGQRGADEEKEMLRLAVSLERVPPDEKVALGELLMSRFSGADEDFWLMARLATREPLGGSVDRVVEPAVVEGWVDRMLASSWQSKRLACLALVETVRITGDRGRDVDPALVDRVSERLVKAGQAERFEAVLRGEALEQQEDRAALLGDALPVGLRLA